MQVQPSNRKNIYQEIDKSSEKAPKSIANERKTSKKTTYEARTQGGQGWDLLELISKNQMNADAICYDKSRIPNAFSTGRGFREDESQKSISS